MPKYIRLLIDPTGAMHNGKPLYWIFNKRSNQSIGQIFWYPTWRLWAARFQEATVWSEDCLADVRAFIDEVAKENQT